MHWNVRRRSALPAVLFGLLAVSANPAGTQQTPPVRTLAGGSEVISIDFVALGRDGLPLLDLKLEEVTLKVDGKTRVIKALRLVRPGDQGQTPGGGEPPPPAYGSNTVADAGRSIVLVVDDESMRPGNEPPMKNAIGQFLANLGPRDQVALVTVPHGDIKVNFTSDHDDLRREVTAITGQAPQSETADEASCRTRNTLQRLASTIEVLGGAVGPTTVAFFTSSLMGARSAVTISGGRGGAANNIGMCEILPEEFQRVGAAAAASRTNLYVIQHDPMVASATPTPTANQIRGSDSPRAGIENLAGVTGGTLLALAGGNDNALARILRETAAYYVATFDAEPAERNASSHQTSVKVARDGTTVRSRPDLIINRTDTNTARATATTPQAMMLDPRMFTDLPIRVAGYTARNTGDSRLKVIALAEPVEPGVSITAASAGVFDSAGRLTAQWTAGPADLGGPMVMSALLVPEGNYRLRMALADSTGRRGTADYELVSELIPAGPLKLSAIVLGLSRNGDFRPKLEFKAEPVAIASFEIYGGQAGAAVKVIIEIAQSLNGPAFLAMPVAMAATREEDKFQVTAAVPIGALPPGDYVVRAIVNAEGQTEGRVVRTLRKAQ